MVLTFHIKKVNSKYKWLMDFKRLITGMFFTGFLISLQAQEKSNYYVICNKQNNATLNEKMLKEILYGEVAYWPSGEIINLVLYKSTSPESKKFAESFFGGSVINVQKHWLSLVFQGRAAQPPLFFETTSEIINYVETSQNAIAVIFSGPWDKIKIMELEK